MLRKLRLRQKKLFSYKKRPVFVGDPIMHSNDIEVYMILVDSLQDLS